MFTYHNKLATFLYPIRPIRKRPVLVFVLVRIRYYNTSRKRGIEVTIEVDKLLRITDYGYMTSDVVCIHWALVHWKVESLLLVEWLTHVMTHLGSHVQSGVPRSPCRVYIC